jgi:hypothetical protein
MLKVRFGILIAAFVIFFTGINTAQQDTTDTPTRDREFETETDTYQNDTYQNNTDQNDTFQQDENTTTQAHIDDLRSRFNLTEDQVTRLNDVMVRYQSESTTIQGTPETNTTQRSEIQRRYNTEIEDILSEDQRIQWRSYSETWWNSVNSTGNNMDDGTDLNRDSQRESDTEMDTETDTDTPRDNTDTDTDTDVR